MKPSIIIAFLISMCSVVYGTPEEVSLEISSITTELETINRSMDVLKSLEINQNDKKIQLQELHENRNLLYDRILNLARSIRPDHQMFEYCGLLAMGKVRYERESRTYGLSVYAGDNMYGPKRVFVQFDVNGIILHTITSVPNQDQGSESSWDKAVRLHSNLESSAIYKWFEAGASAEPK